MSEEILKALMDLFAILLKQEQNVETYHTEYIKNFLSQQLSEEQVNHYFKYFEEVVQQIEQTQQGSSNILGICKQINRTLVQEQKIIVLIRLFELINIDRKFTKQRMNILNTAAMVFKLDLDEIEIIQDFILKKPEELNDPNILIIHSEPLASETKFIYAEQLIDPLVILSISSSDLYILKYTGSENILLNGLTLNSNRIYVLAKGSTLRFPKNKPVFYSDVASRFMSELHPFRFSFNVQDLQYKFANGNTGIQHVSFSETQGRLIGIMGASGAGKTTLLNILCGLEAPTKGKVLVNNINLHTRKELVKSVIGYIPQDDLLIEDLTVFENLYFNAKFCFRDKSKEELVELVEKTLSSLALSETKNLKVGSSLNKSISGGQRKRLNIALELIREPSILFVDEPTSGLSSRDSENVMDLLRELTLKGKLVVVVIHQPSSDIYKMFDRMLILDTGGYMIYYGNPIEAMSYFKKIDNQINHEAGECPVCGTVNPEMIFNIIEAKVVDEFGNYTPNRKIPPAKWEEFQKAHNIPKPVRNISDSLPQTLHVPHWLEQFKIYITRDALTKISNKQYVLLTMLEAPILGLILSYIIRYIVDPHSSIYIFRENDNIPIYIFMSLIVALFLGLTVSAEEIFRDRKILKREAFLNLSRTSYLFSKIALLFIISAIQSFLFIIIANSILDIKGMYFSYWFALFSTAALANMLGLNISNTFNSAITIYIVIPLLIIPMMVLSGAMFSFEKLNRSISTVGKTPLIADLMPTKWSYEALMVHQFKDNKYGSTFFPFEKIESDADFKQVYYLPELEKKLENCIKDYQDPTKKDRVIKDLIVLKNEITLQKRVVPIVRYDSVDNLCLEKLNAIIFEDTKNYFKKLHNYYNYVFMKTNQEKEDLISQLMKTNSKEYYKIKNSYFNESVSDIVTNAFEKNKILEFKGGLIQQIDPIYLDPNPSCGIDFRSHFMASHKCFLGMKIDTFWFNMLIIWIYSCILYICLYFEVLKKSLIFIEKIKKKK